MHAILIRHYLNIRGQTSKLKQNFLEKKKKNKKKRKEQNKVATNKTIQNFRYLSSPLRRVYARKPKKNPIFDCRQEQKLKKMLKTHILNITCTKAYTRRDARKHYLKQVSGGYADKVKMQAKLQGPT